VSIAFRHDLRGLGSNTSSAVRRRRAIRLWLGRKSIAPPPEAAGTQQSYQDYADDRYPEHPANCQLRNQDKDEQQNDAGDYEDGGESHGESVASGQWSVVSDQ